MIVTASAALTATGSLQAAGNRLARAQSQLYGAGTLAARGFALHHNAEATIDFAASGTATIAFRPAMLATLEFAVKV